MGNVSNKCSCLYNKNENTMEIENNETTNSFPAKKSFIIEEDFMKSKSIVKTNTFHNIDRNPNYSSKDNQSRPTNTILTEIEKNKDLTKIYNFQLTLAFKQTLKKIQATIKTFLFRKKYPKIRQKLKEITDRLIDNYEIQFNTPTLYRADQIKSSNFDKHGWKKYYDNSTYNLLLSKFSKGILFDNCIIVYSDISFYRGSVNIKNQRCGHGTLTDIEGVKFQGNWVDNKFNGWGRYIDTEGNFYEGKL